MSANNNNANIGITSANSTTDCPRCLVTCHASLKKKPPKIFGSLNFSINVQLFSVPTKADRNVKLFDPPAL